MNRSLRSFLAGQVPVLTLVALVILVGLVDPSFLSFQTLMVLTSDTMTLFLMAAGATFVILMGGIDLSVQAVASMTSVVVAAALPEIGFLAVPVAVAAGGLAGLAGGLSHTKLRIPSFISTLAVGGVVTTIAFLLSDARSINISGESRDAHLYLLVGETWG